MFNNFKNLIIDERVNSLRKRIKYKIDKKYELIYDKYYETIDLRYNENNICTIWKHYETELNEENYNKLNNENNILIKYIIKLINLYFEEENENNKKEKNKIFNNLKNIILNNGI